MVSIPITLTRGTSDLVGMEMILKLVKLTRMRLVKLVRLVVGEE